MLRLLLICFSMMLLLTACAGGKSDMSAPGALVDRGELTSIESERIQITVQPEINLLLVRALITIPAGFSANREEAALLLHKDAYIEHMRMNGREITPSEARVIKTRFFPETLTDSDWDRISQFASFYRFPIPQNDGAGPHQLEIGYSMRVTEAMTSIELENDEFILDGIGFWYPSNLDNSYTFNVEVTHPSRFFVELLDNSAPSEEVTPTMSRTDFTVSGLTDPLLIIGYEP